MELQPSSLHIQHINHHGLVGSHGLTALTSQSSQHHSGLLHHHHHQQQQQQQQSQQSHINMHDEKPPKSKCFSSVFDSYLITDAIELHSIWNVAIA